MKRLLALILSLPLLAAGENDSKNAFDPEFLWSQSTLYRDEWGVPHVYADDLRAMAFAFGYAQAEDHIQPMLLAYRAVSGRSAEVLGEDRLTQDTYALQMRFTELAKEAFPELDPDARDLCEGFALGVNTWLLENRANVPDWCEAVEPHEVLALLHAFLLAHAPFDLPEADTRDPGILSAHAWAVAPEKSESGHAMLVINPHAQFEGIYRWYEAHLVSPAYEIAGATIYGLPVMLVGHGPHHGWAVAPNRADIADLFEEVSYDQLMRSQQYRDLYVKVGDRLEKRTVSLWFSQHGPVVASNQGRPVAWKVGGYGKFQTLRQLLDMGRATSIDDFVAALDLDGLPCFNIAYADTDGTIYYVYNAVTGMRPDQVFRPARDAQRTVWERPVPADVPAFRWGDPFPASEMPAIANPQSGYIIASGTPPWNAATNIDLRRDDLPGWLARDTDQPHAARLRQLFDRGPRSFRDLQSMLFDPVATAAPASVRFLLEAADAFPGLVNSGHPDLPAAIDMLRDWDYLADDDPAMTFFHVWSTINGRIVDARSSPADLTDRQQIAIKAASDAARLIVNTYQTLFVPWGEIHVLRRGENEIPLAGGASGDPIFRSDDAHYVNGKWVAQSGYAFAMIVQFSNPPVSVSLVPFGQSDLPDSPHFDDQLPLMHEHRLKVARTTYSDVLRGAVSAQGSLLEFIDRSGQVHVEIASGAPIAGRLIASNRFERRPEEGLAAFSPFVEPLVAPLDVDVDINLTFNVPDRLCAVDNLNALAVYSYHPEMGWQIVEEQSIDATARTIHARDYYDQVYVVLGPEAFLRRDPVELGSGPSVAKLDDIPVQLFSDRLPEPRRPPVVDSATALELGEALGQRVIQPEPKPQQSGPELDNPFGATPGVLEHSNPVDPEMSTANPEPQSVHQSRPEPESISFSPNEEPANVTRAELAPLSPDPESPPPGSVPSDDAVYERDVQNGNIVVRGKSAAPASPESFADSNPRLSISYETPSDWRNNNAGSKAFRLYLAPETARASELRIGSEFDLNPPVDNVLIHMYAESSVRAQSFIVDRVPGALPEGTALFTPIVAVRREAQDVRCTVAVTMRVAPTDCSPENADQLELYVYDASSGWTPMPGAKRPAPLSYQGIDIDARTYAVVGPSHLRRN